jgi:hypothetical protein
MPPVYVARHQIGAMPPSTAPARSDGPARTSSHFRGSSGLLGLVTPTAFALMGCCDGDHGFSDAAAVTCIRDVFGERKFRSSVLRRHNLWNIISAACAGKEVRL